MRYAYKQDSLTGLEEDRRARLPRGRRKWTGSLSQRARAARRLPQAVFKISSYSHSAGAVWDRVNYVARSGEIEAEGPNGETLDLGQLEEMVEEWSGETKAGPARRYAMSAVVSFPKGVDQVKATEAARQFFQAAFADNHDYVFAAHTDARQFHVHVVVQAAGHDGKQIRLNRDDIQDLRILLAEKAQEQGIALDASPRWARGLDAERRSGREAEGIRRRGETPRREGREAWQPEKELREVGELSPGRRMQLEALVEVRRARWERREEVGADEYVEAAERLARKIGELENDQEKVGAVKGAAELAGAGLRLVASFQIPGLVSSIERVDKAINSQIRGLGGGAAQREAITARRGLAEKISQYHQGIESGAAKKAAIQAERGRGEAAPTVSTACQALEYARAARRVAGKISKLTNDQDRVAAVKEAVSLARFGWELAQKATGPPEEREQTRGMIDTAARTLRFAMNRIKDPQAQRAAIQARQTLYADGVKEYRAEGRAVERQRGQEAAQEEGAGRRGKGGSEVRRGRDPEAKETTALEYARAAAKLAGRLPELGRDKEKVEAIQGAGALGAAGLELAQNGRETAVDIEEARLIIWRAQRVMNDQIQGIQGGGAKREAIQANRNLSRALTEYRQERQERRRRAGQAPGAARGDDEPER